MVSAEHAINTNSKVVKILTYFIFDCHKQYALIIEPIVGNNEINPPQEKIQLITINDSNNINIKTYIFLLNLSLFINYNLHIKNIIVHKSL